MEDLHLKLGDLPQQALAARHSLILGQKLGSAIGLQQASHHHLNHQLNQLNQLNQLSQLNHLSQLNQQLQHQLQQQLNLNRLSSGLNLNLGLSQKLTGDHHHHCQMQQQRPLHHQIQMGLGLDLDLDLAVNLDLNLEGSSMNSTSSSTGSTSSTSTTSSDHGSGIGLGGRRWTTQAQVHSAHDPVQDNNGDSLNVKGRPSCLTLGHDDGEMEKDALWFCKSPSTDKPSASIYLTAAKSTLNANATAYTMPTTEGRGLMPKTSQISGDFKLNVEAPVFKPAGLLALPTTSVLPAAPLNPLNPSTPQLSEQGLQLYGCTSRQSIRWRKEPLPDLFRAVLSLMRELLRSVSYPEIINTLAVRLQRPEVELKRHLPHTLHTAVINGYLKKDGNRYTLMSETDQMEIMRRNQVAAKRAKELEKEPLSWRKR
ncbi:uncharacterized protein LOC128260362 [Drosophila gunungcola]|uniref:DUF4777 domain-containing protein n=1 Tax=Drosophila gunungcola TaxID=103775 RepID=A0A9P9YFU3_9MUSC|nr:uncharacterized protein LOC128260362 [Drosophila gunungcola]KAI8036177.1 hypothetical protein M5D96_011037 [Drosophila gunungcola]